jgi:hypothetical protein
MPIGAIESNKQVDYKLVYGKADGMPNSLESITASMSKNCIISRAMDRDTSQRRVTSRLMRRKLRGDRARQKPLYASTTSTFFDISDIFGGVGSYCLAVYPICLSLRLHLFGLPLKSEDTTHRIVERVT